MHHGDMETVTVRVNVDCVSKRDAQRLREGDHRTLTMALYRAADLSAVGELRVDLEDRLAGGAGGEARGLGRGWPAHALNLMVFLSGVAFAGLLGAVFG